MAQCVNVGNKKLTEYLLKKNAKMFEEGDNVDNSAFLVGIRTK
jgi:hypothetical protein